MCIRDRFKVRSVKKYKTKSGEVHFDLKVLFDYVSHESFPLLGLQKAAGLEEETLQGLKEIFLKFDTDMDGVITMDQVAFRPW